VKKTKQLITGLLLTVLGLGTLQAEECPSKIMEGNVCLPKNFPLEVTPGGYGLNLTQGQTLLSNDVYNLHMLILWICVVVGIGVFGTMFYSIYHHRKSKGHVAEQFHENTTVEIIWTLIPALILISMAIPATKTLLEMDDVQESDMTVKVTGWQWKWEYDYQDSGIHFFSNLDAASNQARQLNSKVDPRSVPHYLLRVDEPLVIPVNKKIRFVFTAADVLHSWWVPDLGWKKDAIPGFINEAWTSVSKAGVYRGQCTELCGKDHAFMPVVVIAMEQNDYDSWKQKKLDLQKQGNDDSDQTHEQLVTKGAEIYAKNCSTCHMENGAGIPGAFPALTNSGIVNGDIIAQANLILNGKNAMPAFGKQLSASELAAVITFTRNGLGNSKGDEIQPKAIKSLLAGETVEAPASSKSAETTKPQKLSEKPKPVAKAIKPAEAVAKETAKSGTPKAEAKSNNDEVENVQFAGDKFYPQNKVTDKPAETKSTEAEAHSGNKMNLQELVAKGEGVYEKNCQSCHQKDGAGMPPMFPALKGSAVVKGKIDEQIQLMLKGKGVMPAFGKSLSAEDFAAVLAYSRNKLGNSVGDFKQPSEIKALQ
jgi:cytochrome c oxidase subunit II